MVQDIKTTTTSITGSGSTTTTVANATKTSPNYVIITGNTSWTGSTAADQAHTATSDTTPTITGYVYAKSTSSARTINIYADGVLIGSTTSTTTYDSAHNGYAWTFTVPDAKLLSVGNHSFTAIRSGTGYVQSSAYKLTIDSAVTPAISGLTTDSWTGGTALDLASQSDHATDPHYTGDLTPGLVGTSGALSSLAIYDGTTLPYDCYVEQPGTIGRALAAGKGSFDVHLYVKGNGITQVMGEVEANALGLTAQGYVDKGALFASSAPVIAAMSPADGSASFGVQDNIVLTFSDAIQRGAGTIAIHSGSATGDLVASFNAATDGTHLVFNGNNLTIDPDADLASGTHYFVTLESGSVIDLSGNRYPGSSEYDFWTKSIHNAEMSMTVSNGGSGGGGEIFAGLGALGLLAWLAL